MTNQHFNSENIRVPHAYPEQTADLGEVTMNYAVVGRSSAPALLLIPGQTESWWVYETVIKLLESDFQIFAVDLRGQGGSTRTPGRYTFDNMGNDLVRFIQLVIKRPAIVAGSSAGGVLAAWLSAYAPPGLVRAVYLEDAPLFSSELIPAYGHGIRQGAIGLLLQLFSTYLGDQWTVGDWKRMQTAAHSILPEWMLPWVPASDEPKQNLKEYDPEWARASYSGSLTAGCNHKHMLMSVKTPMMFTHHFRGVDPDTDLLQGAISDLQVAHVQKLVEGTGQSFEYHSLPNKGHALHAEDPELYVKQLQEWIKQLP